MIIVTSPTDGAAVSRDLCVTAQAECMFRFMHCRIQSSHDSTRHIRKVSTVRLLKKLKFIFKICYFYQIRHTLNYFST